MAPNSFKSSLCAQHLMWEGLGKAFCERTGRFLYLSLVCVCECMCVFVFVWTMTVSVVPEELMSRWSEWDSAYSLSLLFTLALISLSASVFVRVYVSLSQAVSLSFAVFLALFRFCLLHANHLLVHCLGRVKSTAAYLEKCKKHVAGKGINVEMWK